MGRKIVFLISLLILGSCSTNTSSFIHKYEYSDIENKKVSYLDVFSCSNKRHYIYYYQVDCYHCHGIKSKIISFALYSEEDVYFIEVKEDYGFTSHTKEETIGTNNPLAAFALMTPQLSLVEKGRVKETYIGVDEILNIIE